MHVCWGRSAGFRASASSPASCGHGRTTTVRSRSATGRRSRSPSWSPRSAPRSSCTATSVCSTSVPARDTRLRCWPSSRPRSSRSSGCRRSPSEPPSRSQLRATAASRCGSGDGTLGVPERAPFDGIAVAAAAPSVPEALYDQLAPNGRIVVPVGSRRDQQLEIVTRGPHGRQTRTSVPCRFVPLVGEAGFAEHPAR